MSTTSGKRKAQERQAGFRLFIIAAILVGINMLAARFHYGLDLTKEKRFTLSKVTKNLMQRMDDVAVIDVYLEAKNMPAGFQRLRESTRERLQSLREYSHGHIRFRFIDPFEGKTEDEKAAIFKDLSENKGLFAANIHNDAETGSSNQIVFASALVQYKGREMPVRLLENHLGMGPLEKLNYSESLLEYKFADAINQLDHADKPRIAYIVGNNEALGLHTYDALTTISSLYHVDTIDLNDGIQISAAYDAAIICKPTIPFSEKEKFKIDQYVMHGGHMLWMIDQVHVEMDSLAVSEQYLATSYDLNLDDLLFKYGVRVNNDLIEDLQCNRIPVSNGFVDGKPNNENKPWIYYPVFVPSSHHPIVNNMDAVMSRIANSIDTIGNPGINKSVLLESSQYSRSSMAPLRVSTSIMHVQPNPDLFNHPFKIAAVALEGRFQSVFQDRIPASFLSVLKDSLHTPYKASCDTVNSMIVVSDGDIMLNTVSRNGPMELGFWLPDNERFANKSFLLNCLEYLTDRSGLIEARSKDVRLRLLDSGRAKTEATKWEAINIVFPIGMVLIFASVYLFYRKRRYTGS